ncbi:MAG: chemotaxis protein CheX [Campylobacterota bacterium]|nr:chemotaxis protein CheX [Campylobacterota bacterium]
MVNIINEILTKLSIRTIDYFKNDLDMSEINNSFVVKSVDSINYLEITSMISLSKDIKGTIAMSVSSALAKEMVSKFIYGDVSNEIIEQLTNETVSEVLNVTLGNILQDIDIIKNGGKVEISTPLIKIFKTTLQNDSYSLLFSSNLKYKNEIIKLSYFI